MTNSEELKQLLAELRICPEADMNIHFARVTDLIPLLPNNEKQLAATDFYNWANENAALQPYRLAYGQCLLAFADYFNENYEHGLQLFNDARRAFEEYSNKDSVAVCDILYGGIYRTLGNVDLALKALWDAYGQLVNTTIFLHFKLACSFQIASIYVEQGNYEEALPLFKKTLESSEKLRNTIFVINSLQGLGKIYLVQKEYPAAKEALESAIVYSKQMDSPMFHSNLLTELANYYFETGDYNESVKLHTESLELREQHHLLGGSITNLISIAGIFLKQNKPDEAIDALNKGLVLAEQIKVKPKIYQLHKLLAEIYEKKNEFDKSLNHYKTFHEIREQVEIEDSAKKVKNLQLMFEAEQTKKENIVIKKQKAEIEQKNIELQETIDELTRAKVSRKAKALTLIVALVLFIAEDFILDFVLHKLPGDNVLLTMTIKVLIVFSLKPIERGIEHFLLKSVIKKKKKESLAIA